MSMDHNDWIALRDNIWAWVLAHKVIVGIAGGALACLLIGKFFL